MKWTTVSGICEPIGAAIFGLVLKPFLTAEVIQGMLAAGVCVRLFGEGEGGNRCMCVCACRSRLPWACACACVYVLDGIHFDEGL